MRRESEMRELLSFLSSNLGNDEKVNKLRLASLSLQFDKPKKEREKQTLSSLSQSLFLFLSLPLHHAMALHQARSASSSAASIGAISGRFESETIHEQLARFDVC